MYKANLSFTQLNQYLTFMLACNLITHVATEGREEYVVTSQGMEFLQKHSELVQILNTHSSKKL